MAPGWLGALLALLVLTLVGGAPPLDVALSPTTQVFSAGLGGPGLPRRDAGTPEISFIDSPSPTCYRPVPDTGVCYIRWSHLQVEATPPEYIVTMTVSIDGQLRAYHQGFFQTTMVVPGDMYGLGFAVACGWPSSVDQTGLGRTYNYVIRARETSGLGASNYGSVTCPGDVVDLFLPLVRKDGSAVGHR
jgi:hypothetical protein